MCTGSFAKCLGITLLPLAVICVISNIMLFFPGGKVLDDSGDITEEVFYLGGILGSGVVNFGSILFALAGAAGAAYSVIVSCVAINHGPKCFTTDEQINATYPFAEGNYLSNRTLWDYCKGPGDVITWHLTLFCILLVTGLVQIGLCAFQVINGLIGTICGSCCSCCGD
ncbi:transmembrane 4 L6 family member 4 [Labeo rohita]|uniref:Transmembrane 4 L6 family member 4 n=1 Tax=Labeo rohita TaxID=84645 RepID=A0A498NN67_LABRO|nr:transmembrane 4 L6 family member 4 [Labeo rohita]